MDNQNQIVVADPNAIEKYQYSPEQISKQIQSIQKVMAENMKKDEHYGVIEGCGDKPTLLKPGAEKLNLLFRFAPEYKIERFELDGEHREYEFICSLIHIPTGQKVGQGVGVCSTRESKYRYINASRKCPSCGQEKIIKGKQEYGGGWLCWASKGGCGMKFADGDRSIEGQTVGKIEITDPADKYNTVKKIAKKRALVDAVLTATAASDLFAQDLEDLGPDDKPKNGSKSTSNNAKSGSQGSSQPISGGDQGGSGEISMEQGDPAPEADTQKALDFWTKEIEKALKDKKDLPDALELKKIFLTVCGEDFFLAFDKTKLAMVNEVLSDPKRLKSFVKKSFENEPLKSLARK